MQIRRNPISALSRLAAGAGLFILAACSPSAGPGAPHGRDFPAPLAQPIAGPAPHAQAQGEVIGTGPVRVALILPLSGQGNASGVGRAMANGARLAMDFAARGGANTIHIVLKDSGPEEARARAAAQEAVSEGASLILGPLRASAVREAGAVAVAASIPLIGFSNTAGAARPGVYLLSVLPEAEIMRVLSYARAQGRRSAAALVPANAYGEEMGAAFQRAASELGVPVRGVFAFSNEAQARERIEQLVPQVMAGQIDTLFIPDRATAPSFGILLAAAQVPRERIAILGSSDWAGDGAIAAQPYLTGAFFAAIDQSGLAAIAPQYRQRFGGEPHQLATIAYSAVLLASNPVLANAAPRYGPQMLLSPSGFSGRDGLFRFHHDGRGEYGLAINRVSPGGAEMVEPVRLVGITRESAGTPSGGNVIPPVGSSLLQGAY